jgi:hypothetical protein
MTTDKAGPPIPLRRRLRTLNGVELWHVESGEKSRQRTPIISYVVKSVDGERAFDRPHEAWQYFQRLTEAPDRDLRPEPPPIDPERLDTSRPRTPRRRKHPPRI